MRNTKAKELEQLLEEEKERTYRLCSEQISLYKDIGCYKEDNKKLKEEITMWKERYATLLERYISMMERRVNDEHSN
jgi:FtsZ-binding cell division protein ZapB